jgi:putative transposase
VHMPRTARIVVPGMSYHVTQRGNNRQDVFFVDDDRRAYLDILREQSRRYGFAVEGWCLMTNHIHLIGQAQGEDSLAKAFGRTHWLYTQYVNRLHGRSGHLWQNRFYSCMLSPMHFLSAMRYIECNPVRARICRAAWSYEWSSAKAHAEGSDDSSLIDIAIWQKRISGADWRDLLSRRQTDDEVAAIRSSTNRGRPLGTDSFISKIEKTVGRRLRPLAVGRPRKQEDK